MNKTEEYLDSLLNNVSPERKAESERKKRRTSADFIEDFERELNDLDLDEVSSEFEQEEAALKPFEEEGGGFFDSLEGAVATAAEASSASQAEETPLGEGGLADDSWTEPEEEAFGAAGEDAMQSLEDIPADEEPTQEEPVREEPPSAETQEEAYSDEAKEILDLLSSIPSEEELSSLGTDTVYQDDVSAGGEGEEGEPSQNEPKAEQDEDGKKKKKGLFQKIAALLFGKDDDELPEGEEGALDEDAKLEQELGLAGAPAAKGSGKKKKEKKPKEKKAKEKKAKEKKPKEPKPKKEKKPKEPKPKKPKQVDLSPPLPIKQVILIFVMAASVLALVILASNLLGYSMSMKNAKEAYAKFEYVEAYQHLAGLKVKEDDMEFEMQIQMLANLQRKLEGGDALYDAGEYIKALDSYICALGRYGADAAVAAERHIQQEYDYLADQIAGRMKERFGVDRTAAGELYGLESRVEYTCRIYDIVKALGLVK